MSYIEIPFPPRNEIVYETVDSTSGNLDEAGDFGIRLLALLQEGKSFVKTGHIRIGWAEEAIAFANSNRYEVKLLRAGDPADPGGMMSFTGFVYFRKITSN
jgi:hypothetical protein